MVSHRGSLNAGDDDAIMLMKKIMIIIIIIIYQLHAGIYSYCLGQTMFPGYNLRTYIKRLFRADIFTVVVTCKLNLNVEKCGCEGVDGPVDQQIAFLLSCTYLIAPCNRVLVEKLTVSQLVKKFPAFYGTHHLPYSEPDQTSPCSSLPLSEDQF